MSATLSAYDPQVEVSVSRRRTRAAVTPRMVIASRRPQGRAVAEYLLIASPARAQRVAGYRAAEDLCAPLREVPMVTYAEDLPIVRRYWRTVFGAGAGYGLRGPFAVRGAPGLRANARFRGARW
ncbi:hypothetical protein ACQ4WX_46665 [Streptomyces lasalocidi]